MTVSEARNLDREVVESELTFAGFVVFNCPIRADSANVLAELKKSSHDLISAMDMLSLNLWQGKTNSSLKPSLSYLPRFNYLSSEFAADPLQTFSNGIATDSSVSKSHVSSSDLRVI
ncbi:unnamed protein product [Lactuca saligna]|uniref:Uncharacterized protein n=1 Tax=Lactuca saligna TaxID=75948 RepID=A0AA35ZX63_LACSI|nr:unnamed protein product [Lactuca saligna]